MPNRIPSIAALWLFSTVACTAAEPAAEGEGGSGSSDDTAGAPDDGLPTSGDPTTAADGDADGATTNPADTNPGDDSDSDGSDTTGDEPFDGRLSDEQRIAFVHYYSPVIFKKAAENAASAGRDWITNFDFDRDGWNLANNRDSWLNGGLSSFIAGGQPQWRVRPTLYTGVIEFERDDVHSLVLLFHVYHATQGDAGLEDVVPEAGSIHDWERIEIRLDGVTGGPGSGETVNYVVVTEHSSHIARVGNAPNLHFIDTPAGHHPMIFQAEHNDPLGVGFAELRFSETSSADLFAQTQAGINVNGAKDQIFHYIFASEGDPELIEMLGAQRLSTCTAAALASGQSGSIGLAQVPRISYEHQDLADLFVSHWDAGVANTNWQAPVVPILLDEAILDEAGAEEVPAGMQSFFAQAFDDLDAEEHRKGYPRKHWFWGAYQWGATGSFWSGAFEMGTPNGQRCASNGHPDCLNNFMAQHDYFAHIGAPGDGTDDGERGEWLPAGWNTAEAGGFDGRWVQMFDDAVDRDCE
ncbi:MAG: hypothetical protein AAF721_02525 [Myxococcota bacterium]